MHRKSIIPLALLLMSGCAAHQALQDMKDAKADYKACLAQNSKDPAACKRQKDTYESAGEDYNGMSPANNLPGGNLPGDSTISR